GVATADPAPPRRSPRLQAREGRGQAEPRPKPRPSRQQVGVFWMGGEGRLLIGGDRGEGGVASRLWLRPLSPLQVEERSPEVTGPRLRPRRGSGSAHPKVLFTGVVASPAMEEALRSLGGSLATSVFECSHLVSDRVRRTVKFLCALARGVPIVTPEWLHQVPEGLGDVGWVLWGHGGPWGHGVGSLGMGWDLWGCGGLLGRGVGSVGSWWPLGTWGGVFGQGVGSVGLWWPFGTGG
ncbi:MDC1 protein, partial [Urocolius indicus]|nr:MDC1 protein [Urocolius indicus]